MKVKIGVVEKHYYTGVRQLEDIDFDKFPIIKQFMDVNPNATEEELLKYLKKIKDKDFKKFLDELSWNEIECEDLTKTKFEYKIEIDR